jgi:hypothetical protein
MPTNVSELVSLALFAPETSLQRLQNFPVRLPREFRRKLLSLLHD